MYTQWLLALSPILALTVYVIAYLISVHSTRNISLSIFIGILSGLLIEILIMKPFLFSETFFSGLFSYFFFSFCYWAFLNLNITSLRIRLAREIYQENNYPLSMQTIVQRYSPLELIDRRVARLEKTGQIKKLGDTWILCSKKLLLLWYILAFLRKAIIPSRNSDAIE